MTVTQPISIKLHLDGPLDTDAIEREAVTRRLRSELAQLDVAVSAVSGPPLPAGAKAAIAIDAGQLALVLLPLAIPKLIDFLQAWCLRNRDQKIVIRQGTTQLEFPLGGLSSEQLDTVLERFTGRSETSVSTDDL